MPLTSFLHGVRAGLSGGYARVASLLLAGLVLLAVQESPGQKSRPVFQDSVDVIVGTPLSVKDRLRSWSANFANLRYQVAVFRDQAFRDQVSSCKWERDKNYVSDPGAFNIRIVDTVRDAGRFYLRRIARGPDEIGEYQEASTYWVLNVRWPSLPAGPQTAFVYGQSAVLNFAAGHLDYANYSYRVARASDGIQVLAGTGPLVPIDSLWKIDEGEQDTGYVVQGLYAGNPFRYENLALDTIEESTWRVSVAVPALPAAVTLWVAAPKSGERLNLLDVAPQNGWLTSRMFRFIFETPVGTSSVYVRPRTTRQTIRSSPEEFLLPGNPATWANVGDWRVATINVNPAFLRGYSAKSPATVSLIVEFRDQWGQQFRQTYAAKIFSSEFEK